MLFLTELVVVVVVIFNPVLKRVPITTSVVVMVEVLKIWVVVITAIGTTVSFAHTRIERLDKGLARELDSMVEALDMVGFIKGVLEFVEGSCLDVI